MELSKKIVIVTGGAGGIGRVLVNRLIAEGAAVGILDIDRNALSRLSLDRKDLYYRVCDLSNPNEVESAIEDFYQTKGRIDILINNAAVVHNEMLVSLGPKGTAKHSIDTWNHVVNTNLNSVFYATVNVAYKMLLMRTQGVIVNVSSITSEGNAGQSVYSATKAAVRSLTVTWAKELGPWGIRVAGIAPGYTETEATMKSLSDVVLKDWIRQTPLRRLARSEEIADGILFILKNEYFNGRLLELDGGLRI